VTTELRVVRGDIATLDVDAVVNAANTTLLGVAAWMAPFITLQDPHSWKRAAP